VGLHEADEFGRGDASVARTGYAVTLQLSGIEPLCDGSRSDIAYLSDLSGRQYIFSFVHINHPFPNYHSISKHVSFRSRPPRPPAAHGMDLRTFFRSYG
jgi:hypothetical protein